MRLPFLIICLLFTSALATAQSGLIRLLADQVCRCMETVDRQATPYEQAQECVRLVSLRQKRRIRQQLSLIPEKPEHLQILSDRMADILSKECPILSTLRLGHEEPELRWSDGNIKANRKNTGLRFVFPKSPPADASAETVTESVAMVRVTGTVTGKTGRGNLRLLQPDGSVRIVEFPAAINRRLGLVEGQRVTAICAREWRKRKTGGEIALVVRAIE